MIDPRLDAESRRIVYYRLRWLWPLLARPAVARGLRLLGWGLFAAWLLFVGLVLALRYVVLPGVGQYQADIERMASGAVGQPVKIGKIDARWRGINPDLVLDDVRVFDRQGLPAFSLARVESVLSWQSLWRWRPTLSLLAFEGPVLHVRRETSGRITVAGLDAEGESDPAFAEWVLEQRHIRIRNAKIVWEDRLREAPPLLLEDLQLGLDNNGRLHRFGLSALPPANLAARIDIRGEVRGSFGEALDQLSGKIFVELDYADLAGWRNWVDYPIYLPQGRGALRIWGDVRKGEGKLTADVALEELRIRLGRKLPELDLASMRGRLEGRYKAGEWAVAGKKVELLTLDGLRVAPTDFAAEWRQNPQTGALDGSASASFLDLGILARLAAHLPLDVRSRDLLQKHQPQGRVSELRTSWALEDEVIKHYALKASFDRLGVLAGGYFPGASGLSGSLDVNEKGGELTLASAASSLSLPAVFPEPDIALDSLKAHASWKVTPTGVATTLDRLEFTGPDAAGSARGAYRFSGDGPGEIDLQANVDRADARAIWRYMPHVVNSSARAWIRRGVVAGRGYEGRLALKGDLKDFPFRDSSKGKFIVTAKAVDGKIDYVPGWPVIENIEATLTFGIGMKIEASKGTIFGAKLSGVTVEIPDFESHDEMLLVRGVAQGPTTEFFRFIEQSPISEKIDHFTEGMKASGNGLLNLELSIPLQHALDTRLRADYHFQGNQLQPLPGLPPLTQVNGRLQLTENTALAQDITGRIFGGPVKVGVRSTGDKVAVLATGTANVGEVSSHFGWPLMNHLSGTAAWKADVNIRKKNAEVVIESDLVGVSSPLPEPLNKVATVPLPLRVERTTPDAMREIYRISLGKVAQGVIVHRQESWERGVFAVGDAEPRLPEKGLAIRVAVPQIDADNWRHFLPEGATSGEAGASGPLPLSLLALKTPALHLFGRDYSQVEANLRPRDGGWQIGLNTREAVGDIFWRSTGEGWVEGNFKRLVIRPLPETGDQSSTLINSLPGMSLAVDDFRIGDRILGKLDLKARNDKGAWHLDMLNLQNPDGGLKGKGVWVNASRHQTRLDFELTAKDIGKLLDRLGYVDAVRHGTATLAGELQWNGPLTGIHYPSLTGQMAVNAEKGQFNKLEPGVGKLLGLISLQSLPRRLTLDFRDIFSDGLAFDSIEGKLSVRRGVMRTVEPLRIYGPAAQVEMQGETDLKSETQDLQVIVRPEVGSLAAVGTAALINPVVGAAALLANTVLQKPLNRLFSYRYHVTGSWGDPKIDKAGQTEPAKPAEEEGVKP